MDQRRSAWRLAAGLVNDIQDRDSAVASARTAETHPQLGGGAGAEPLLKE